MGITLQRINRRVTREDKKEDGDEDEWRKGEEKRKGRNCTESFGPPSNCVESRDRTNQGALPGAELTARAKSRVRCSSMTKIIWGFPRVPYFLFKVLNDLFSL